MTLINRVKEELSKLELDEYHVQLEGNHITIFAVGEIFATLSLVKKQQYILKQMKPFLATNEIHAVNVRTFTPEQWKKDRLLYAL